jgi:hypothetical protein
MLLSVNYSIQLAVFALHTLRLQDEEFTSITTIRKVQLCADRVEGSRVHVNEIAFRCDDASLFPWHLFILVKTINVNLLALVD